MAPPDLELKSLDEIYHGALDEDIIVVVVTPQHKVLAIDLDKIEVLIEGPSPGINLALDTAKEYKTESAAIVASMFKTQGL